MSASIFSIEVWPARLPGAFVILWLAALPAGTAAAAPVTYSCEAGVAFEIEYSARRDKAELTISGDRILLSRAEVATGFRYEGSGYELHGEDPVALFTLPGGRTIDCRIRPQQLVTPQENTTPEPAAPGPSFDCAGEHNATEQRICASALLSELDGRMAGLYEGVRKRLRGGERGQFQSEQGVWLEERNKCADKDACIEDHYYGRIAYLEEYESLGSAPAAPPIPAETSPGADAGGASFPHAAQSWGGVVRSGPGTRFKRLGSVKEGESVTLLENTGVQMNGYVWFKIKYGSRTGYQWGGLLCAEGTAVPGTYQVCE